MDEEKILALRSCIESLEVDAVRLVKGRIAGVSYAELCGQLSLSVSGAHKMFFSAKKRLQECVQAKMS